MAVLCAPGRVAQIKGSVWTLFTDLGGEHVASSPCLMGSEARRLTREPVGPCAASDLPPPAAPLLCVRLPTHTSARGLRAPKGGQTLDTCSGLPAHPLCAPRMPINPRPGDPQVGVGGRGFELRCRLGSRRPSHTSALTWNLLSHPCGQRRPVCRPWAQRVLGCRPEKGPAG